MDHKISHKFHALVLDHHFIPLDDAAPPSWDSTRRRLTELVIVDDPWAYSWPPCNKDILLRVILPGEILTAGTIFGLTALFFGLEGAFLHSQKSHLQYISKLSRYDFLTYLFFGTLQLGSWCPTSPHISHFSNFLAPGSWLALNLFFRFLPGPIFNLGGRNLKPKLTLGHWDLSVIVGMVPLYAILNLSTE